MTTAERKPQHRTLTPNEINTLVYVAADNRCQLKLDGCTGTATHVVRVPAAWGKYGHDVPIRQAACNGCEPHAAR